MTKSRAWTITENTATSFRPPAYEDSASLKDKTKIGQPKPEHIEFDKKFAGFGLRIRRDPKTGKETRTYIYQHPWGKITLGTVGNVPVAKARDIAGDYQTLVRAGRNPSDQKRTARTEAANTFGAAVAKYLEAKKPEIRPRSYVEFKRYLEQSWKPLHGRALASIDRQDVTEQTRLIGKQSGPIAANRARACLSAFFVWAISEYRDLGANPVINSNKLKENEPRERVLLRVIEREGQAPTIDASEAARVWLAADKESDYDHIVRLLLLTGCRRDEIGSLQWPEIDLEARTIALPPERTKNGKRHLVPLPAAAVAILKGVKRVEGRPFVFGRGDGGFSGWSKSKVALDKLCGVKDWTLHDLRRTVRTGLGALGIAPHVAEAVINHLPPKLLRTYDRNNYEAEKRAALDTWATHLAVAVAQASGANVTQLPQQRA